MTITIPLTCKQLLIIGYFLSWIVLIVGVFILEHNLFTGMLTGAGLGGVISGSAYFSFRYFENFTFPFRCKCESQNKSTVIKE